MLWRLFKSYQNEKKIRLLTILLTISISNAQEIDENKNFIYKNDETILYGKSISYNTPPFQGNYFKIDSLTIKSKDVRFYKSGEYFYGNTQNSQSSFAIRIIKGRINYYELNISYSVPTFTHGVFGRGFVQGSNSSYYYNRGFNTLKAANYENLSIDLKDNLESINFLNKHQVAKQKRTLTYVLGGIAELVGILTSGKKTGKKTTSFNFMTNTFETVDETELQPLNLSIGLVGFGVVVATALSSKKKKQYIQKAIEVYNEN